MRRLLILLALLALPSLASAREAWRGFCETGNQSVVTSGISSTTKVQRSYPRCTVLILVHGGGVATIYADNNGTPLANPFQANLDGSFVWYSDNGRYDQQISGGGLAAPFTFLDILLCDPAALGACGTLASGVTSVNTLTGDLTLIAGSNITITPTGPSTLVIAATSSGGGCSPPGTDTGIITEHPVGTCFDSTHATWNDATPSSSVNGHILLIGDGTNSVTAPTAGKAFGEVFHFGDHNTSTSQGNAVLEAFSFGDHNAVNCPVCGALGDFNTVGLNVFDTQSFTMGGSNTIQGSFVAWIGDTNVIKKAGDVYGMGDSNSFNAGGNGTFNQDIFLEFGATLTLAGTNSSAIDIQAIGSQDTFTAGLPSGGGTTSLNCLHGVGGSNSFNVGGGGAGSSAIAAVSWVGKSNSFSTNGVTGINTSLVAGNSNTLSGQIIRGSIYGSNITLTGCTDCYLYGKNINWNTDNSIAIGMSASDIGLIITNSGGTHDNVRRTPMAFTSLPACAAGTEGSFAAITDSTTNTWGAVITGSSTNHVMGYCNGTNWTVMGAKNP